MLLAADYNLSGNVFLMTPARSPSGAPSNTAGRDDERIAWGLGLPEQPFEHVLR